MSQPELTTAKFRRPKDLCEALDVSYSSIIQFLNEGRIRGIRYGTHWRIPLEEYERILEEGIEPDEAAA